MKRFFLVSLAILLLVTLILGGCAKPAPAPAPGPAPTPAPTPTPVKPIELRFSTWLPPVHHLPQNIISPWAAEVGQRTEGRVKVNVFTTEALGKQNDHLQMLVTGIADIATCQPRYSEVTERFPLSEVFNIPWFIADEFTDPTGTAKAIREMAFEKYLIPMHLKDVKVLWTSRFSARVLHMATKPVRKLEDMQGLLIGVVGEWTQRAYQRYYGASVENLFAPEVYTALERKMVDGTEYPLSFLVGFRLVELVKYVTMLNVGSGVYFYAMSMPAWNKLSPADQKIIDELCAKYSELDAESWIEEATLAEEAGKEAGIEFITLSPEEKQRWADICQPLLGEFTAEMDAKGLPASEMVDDILKMMPK